MPDQHRRFLNGGGTTVVDKIFLDDKNLFIKQENITNMSIKFCIHGKAMDGVNPKVKNCLNRSLKQNASVWMELAKH